jgi:heme/copper-type cytochrome/quinol oxidase subunit 1
MACAPVDIPIHDTYFIVAHIHYVLFGGSIFGIFAGLYHWYPKWFGRKMNPKWGVIHFVMNIIAFNGTFFIMHALGVGGHPRRYATQLNFPTLEHLQGINVFMTICAMMLGMAQIPFFYNFFVSLPRKLGRSMVTFFTVMFGLPIVVGLSAWGVSSEAGSWISWLCADPETGYTGFQKFFGNLVLWATIIGVGCHMFAGLPGQGRAWLCVVLATFIYLWKVSGDWDLTAVGFGAFYMWVVMAAMLVIWEVGGAFKVKELLQRIMYFIFLPAFLAPLIMKQDPYIWLGIPEMFAYKWHLLILSGIPGAAYCVVRRPIDVFGVIAGDNPWKANSLEWCTTSPPPLLNFDEIPTVHRGPYEYSSPVVEKDWITQVEELPQGVVEPTGH